MKYDFDAIIDRRNTNAENVEGFRQYIFGDADIELPFADEEFIRMWVADMEFAVAPEIRQAIRDRVDRKIFGYTMDYDPEYYQAMDQWCRERYDWSFPKEQLCYSPGIVPALFRLTGHLVREDEKVLIVTPSYGPFRGATKFNHCGLVCSSLKYDGGDFTIDFADFAEKAADPQVKLVIWCNPHNPSGRVWSEEELKQVAAIVEDNDLWIISDEIHCDLLRQGLKHTPMGKIMKDYRKLVTCMANSKTFNIAGLMMSHIIIRDEELRSQFKSRDYTSGNLNPLSIAANKAAFLCGEEWLDQLKSYLDGNFRFVDEFLKEKLPEAVFRIPDATYLAWVDLSLCLPDVDDLPLFFAREAGVLLEGGDRLFVADAKGFVRLNLAMPRSLLAEGMKRIAEAVSRHRK